MAQTAGKTVMPVIVGILNLTSGILSVICFIPILIAVIVVGFNLVTIYIGLPGIAIAFSVLVTLAILALFLGILAIIGGAFALQRKNWGWALVGSICALSPSFLLGLVAIILTAVSRNEFE